MMGKMLSAETLIFPVAIVLWFSFMERLETSLMPRLFRRYRTDKLTECTPKAATSPYDL